MSDQVVIHGFETSNNFKVRVALGFKGIGYRFETIDPADRAGLVKISGQPFSPVMVHGDLVMFDSGAILRYLEGNFSDTPRLFSADYETMRGIEDWEWFGRTELHEALMIMVRQKKAGINDEAKTARAAELFAVATGKIEAALADSDWLAHSRLTAADVTCGAVVHRVAAMGAFEVPQDRPNTYAWADKVMAYDRGANG
jgi:glutathione S-transferase